MLGTEPLLKPSECVAQGRPQRNLRRIIRRHDEHATRLKDARDLPNRELGLQEVFDYLAQYDQVDACICEWELLCIPSGKGSLEATVHDGGEFLGCVLDVMTAKIEPYVCSTDV